MYIHIYITSINIWQADSGTYMCMYINVFVYIDVYICIQAQAESRHTQAVTVD